MTSAAQLAANRRNARLSTGPRTPAGKARVAQNGWLARGPSTGAGKARSAQNARRHGLTSAICDSGWSAEVKALARTISGTDADAERTELACRIAEAQIDLVRVRQARRELFAAVLRSSTGTRIARLEAIDRYERRAFARRKSAVRDFDTALCQDEANPI
jgi:hypothetical protein